MHDDVTADARCDVLIDYWCVILACIENYIKWLIVCHLYIVSDDTEGFIWCWKENSDTAKQNCWQCIKDTIHWIT
jgi:hypothetical protein